VLLNAWRGPTTSADHNLYVKGAYAYEANYRSGLSVLDLCCIPSGELHQVASFDIYPEDDDPRYSGAWSVYPYFESGVVVVSGIEAGLFVLRPMLPDVAGGACPGSGWGLLPDLYNALRAVKAGADANLSVRAAPPEGGGFNVHRSEDKTSEGAVLGLPPTTASASHADRGVIGDGSTYFYKMRALTACGFEGP